VGTTPIEDVEETVDMKLRGEEDTYDTFGGFIIANLAYIPQDGEQPEFTFENLTVKVQEISEKRILMTEVIKAEISEDGEESENEDGGESAD
jgi:putative hemolysin